MPPGSPSPAVSGGIWETPPGRVSRVPYRRCWGGVQAGASQPGLPEIRRPFSREQRGGPSFTMLGDSNCRRRYPVPTCPSQKRMRAVLLPTGGRSHATVRGLRGPRGSPHRLETHVRAGDGTSYGASRALGRDARGEPNPGQEAARCGREAPLEGAAAAADPGLERIGPREPPSAL